MPADLDVLAVGNAIVDVIATADDVFLADEGLVKGSMSLIDALQAQALYGRMRSGVETSGGSAGNTAAGLASLGAHAGFIGKVGADGLGEVFRRDISAAGVRFATTTLDGEAPTGRCLINVTPDGERTMCTFLGAANRLSPADVDPDLVGSAEIVYLEGYLFDPPDARAAFQKAALAARAAGRRIALSLSDAFVVERHRAALLAFVDSHVDIVFANQTEVLSLFQTGDMDAALQALVARVDTAAVTLGASGSVALSRTQSREFIAAEPVERVIDTTGAGDQYAAGFLAGLTRGMPLGACGRLGALAAAEVISHFGPRPQLSLARLAQDAGLA